MPGTGILRSPRRNTASGRWTSSAAACARDAGRFRRETARPAPRRPDEPNWRSSMMDAHTLKPAATLAGHAKTPFPGGSAEYRKAREALLAEEIEFRRPMSRLTEQRRALPPGPMIEKNYRFKDANGADVGLLDLFGKHDTLMSYFWMFGPQ